MLVFNNWMYDFCFLEATIFDVRNRISNIEKRTSKTKHQKTRTSKIYFGADFVFTTLYGTQMFGLQHDIAINSAGQHPPVGQVPS